MLRVPDFPQAFGFATSLVLALCAIAANVQPASSGTFRVVVNLTDQYKSPGSLSEGWPGLFF